MIGKVDLVMWAKNGESSLPRVLKRIDEVIPYENINQKILVDDHSTDKTVFIAKDFGWNVYPNPRGGISSGANEVLRHVKSDFFVSIEQDVVLAKGWWEKIPPYMEEETVAVAQGIRISTEPTLRKLEEYNYSRMKGFSKDPVIFGVSIDNTIFRTAVIRQLGGFPDVCPVCCDTILMKKMLYETRYKWVIDETTISDHIRRSISEHIKRSHEYAKRCARTPYCSVGESVSFWTMFRLFLTSPVRAGIIAWKKRCLKVLYVYPFIRYERLRDYVEDKV